MKKELLLLSAVLLLLSCATGKKKAVSADTDNQNSIVYATGFSLEEHPGYRYIVVLDPWDSTRVLNRYVLVHRDSVLPAQLPEGVLVRYPVNRVAVYASVDAGALSLLGQTDKIAAICEPKYVPVDEIQQLVAAGKISDIGPASKPVIEKLVLANCDLIFTTPYKDSSYGLVGKLGIPLAEVTNYMELSPLGRCEWIKFYAAFFDCLPLADSIFGAVERRYAAVREQVRTAAKKVTLLPEKRYGQTWYVPGGASFAVNLYKDAGADYFWSEDGSTGSLALSFEEVFSKAAAADVWLIRYFKESGPMTLRELNGEYDSYSKFTAFQQKKVYGCNTATSDYYTFVPFRPDIELMDIAKILYPELFPDHTPVYYQQLQ